MIDDHNYWDSFYESHCLSREPSSFAQYVEDRYLQKGKSLLELGCGNGRDAIFFASKGKIITALDLSSKTILSLNSMNVKNATFINQDFSRLSDFNRFDYVYSRFTMHSVDEETERSVLSHLPGVLNQGGIYFLEARSLKDKGLNKVFGEGHFRRYLDFEETVLKLEHEKFEILEKTESQGLSPYGDEDPFLMRIVAKKI